MLKFIRALFYIEHNENFEKMSGEKESKKKEISEEKLDFE